MAAWIFIPSAHQGVEMWNDLVGERLHRHSWQSAGSGSDFDADFAWERIPVQFTMTVQPENARQFFQCVITQQHTVRATAESLGQFTRVRGRHEKNYIAEIVIHIVDGGLPCVV